MRKIETVLTALLFGFALAGCGDITVNQPARPVIIEKKETPVIIEKTVEKPVIVEKTSVEKPTIVIEKH